MGREVLKNRLFGERGMALLLVLTVVSVLTALVLQFNGSMRFTLVDAAHYRDREMLRAMVQSGVDIGCAALRADRLQNEFDWLQEGWAALAEAPLTAPFNDGELLLTIENLDGRLPINRLVPVVDEDRSQGPVEGGLTPEQVQDMLLRLLTGGSFAVEDEIEAREIVDALVDWLDGDDEESPYGAESGYYESLENPYKPRNGPIRFVDELLLVRGISAELLYGNDEKRGLREYISVYNDNGTININTAPLEVLRAFDDRIGMEGLEALDEFRRDETAGEQLASPTWYQSVAGWPGDVVLDGEGVTTSGTYFLLRSLAIYQESRMSLQAVIRRVDDKEMEIMYLRVE